MNIQFQRIKSIVYLCVWIFLVIIGWSVWSLGLDAGSYVLPLTFGLTVGVLSGLPPARAFLACFCGFFIIALLIGFYFFIFEDLIIFGILCGLFAMTGAVIRRIVFRWKIEELYLNLWQWVLLVGGVSAIADYFTIPGVYSELFIYHRLTVFSRYFISTLVGLFALGLYTGFFFHQDYKKLMKSVKRFSLGGHGVFLMYMVYLSATGHTSRESFLFVPLTLVFLAVVLIGTRIGYSRSGSLCDLEQPT